MFGIGIIGCGKIAQVRHIPEYAEHKDAKLLGFYDINLERAADLASSTAALPTQRWKNCWTILRSMQYPSVQPTSPMRS